MNKISGFIIRTGLLLFSCAFSTACGQEQMQTIPLSEKSSGEEIFRESESTFIKEDNETSNTEIFVYVTGQVKNPGVYRLKENARLYEVIELAGGFTDKASESGINLAEKLTDGQQVKVLSKSEYKKIQNADKDGKNLEQRAGEEDSKESLVNINTAMAGELMTLPGIGASKAAAIVEYREENGMFAEIEDIMKVPGIKEASFRLIKSLIKV